MSPDPTVTDPDKYVASDGSSTASARPTSSSRPAVVWIAAQEHAGENIGSTETHSIFVELKEPNPAPSDGAPELGPSGAT